MIPIGTLVEDVNTGVRLFVVYHGKDCDGTPLYWLSTDREDTVLHNHFFANHRWIGGYPERNLKKVRRKQDALV